MFAAQPLPVDVIPNWWDIVVDSVGVASGIATAGALWVAALTYRRQVYNASREQASKVRMTTMRFNFRSPVKGDDSLAVENASDLWIRVNRVYFFPEDEVESVLVKHKFPAILTQHSMLMVARMESEEQGLPGAIVDFSDANGRAWRLSGDNVLLHRTRLTRLREMVENLVVPEERMPAVWARRIERGH